MLDADKKLLLSGFLGKLPDVVAARLAKAVELDRLSDGSALPHAEILAALRPQLRGTAKSQRTPTPLRVFCTPFEDLLVDASKGPKQKGRIARNSVIAVWQWLATDLMSEELKNQTAALRVGILKGDRDAIRTMSETLWSSTSAALLNALADDAKRATAVRVLGPQAAADAHEMALLLSASRDVTELQAKLTRPVELTEDVINLLREIYDKFVAEIPDVAPYLVLIVVPRLARVWEILRVVSAISRQSTDTLIASTDIGVVGELLFTDLEAHVAAIKAFRPIEYDTKKLLREVSEFTELSSGMAKELGIRRDGKWGLRLGKNRSEVSRHMETLLERAPKDITSALPQPKIGSGSRSPHPPLELSRLPDPDRVTRAMRGAELLRDARPYATGASYTAKLNEAFEQISIELRGLGEDVIRDFRVASPEIRDNAERQLVVLLDLCRFILGDEDADLLLRRSKVPANAA